MIGIGGAPTSAPAVALSPLLVDDGTTQGVAGQVRTEQAGPGSGTMFLTVLPQPFTPGESLTVNGAPPAFAVRVGPAGRTFAATPAVSGTQLLPQVRYPLVARIPADLLTGNAVTVRLVALVPQVYPASLALQAVDVDAPPGAGAPTPVAGPRIPQLSPQLAVLAAKVLDASGTCPRRARRCRAGGRCWTGPWTVSRASG